MPFGVLASGSGSSQFVDLDVPAWAWVVELRHDWRLARRLEEVPAQKVIKVHKSLRGRAATDVARAQ